MRFAELYRSFTDSLDKEKIAAAPLITLTFGLKSV